MTAGRNDRIRRAADISIDGGMSRWKARAGRISAGSFTVCDLPRTSAVTAKLVIGPRFARTRWPNLPYFSQLECLIHRGMKQLLDFHQSRRQALRMMVAQEELQRVAVRLVAPGPQVAL